MKRLLALIGLVYLSVLAVVFYCGKTSAFIVFVVALVLLFVFLLHKNYRDKWWLSVVAIVSMLACFANMSYTTFVYDKTVDNYDGYSGVMTATLLEEPYKMNSTYRYLFRVKSLADEKAGFNFQLYDRELWNIEPFDVVKLNVSLSSTDDNYSISKKCFFTSRLNGDLSEVSVVGYEQHHFRSFAIKLRQYIRQALGDTLSVDTFSLCRALLIGDKYALSHQLRQQFDCAGVSHLVVVSGLHFSILTSFFMLMAHIFYRYRGWFMTVAVAFIFVYMAVTGFTASVVRSAVMLLLCCIGMVISRDPCPENSLGIAAVVVTCTNPYSVGDVGMLLSFATTFSILKLAPVLSEKCFKRIKFIKYGNFNIVIRFLCKLINRIVRSTVLLLCMNISAYVASLPLVLVFFGGASTVSVIATFLLSLPIEILLIVSLIIAVVYYIPFVSLIAPLLGAVAELLAAFTFDVVGFFERLPFSYLHIDGNYVYVWIVMSVILFVLCVYIKTNLASKAFVLLSVIILLTGFITNTYFKASTAALYVYDVGDGVAVMYTDNSVSGVLAFDCTSDYAYEVTRKLKVDAGEIDYCSSVSGTLTGYNSLKTLCEEFALSEVLLYDEKRTVSIDDCNIMESNTYDKVLLGENMVAEYYAINNSYLVYLTSLSQSVMILPCYVNACDIPPEYRYADTIIMQYCPPDSQLLSCDTLIITNDIQSSYNIMKFSQVHCNRVMLTCESDIQLLMEV